MQLKQLELASGGTLTVYLRDCCERMPNVLDRPLVLVVPGGGYTHVSAREGDPVALQFAAAGYHAAVLDYAICEQAKDGLPLRQLAIEPTLLRPILPIKVFGVGFMYGFLYHTAEEKLNFRNQIRVCGFCVIHMCKLLG